MNLTKLTKFVRVAKTDAIVELLRVHWSRLQIAAHREVIQRTAAYLTSGVMFCHPGVEP